MPLWRVWPPQWLKALVPGEWGRWWREGPALGVWPPSWAAASLSQLGNTGRLQSVLWIRNDLLRIRNLLSRSIRIRIRIPITRSSNQPTSLEIYPIKGLQKNVIKFFLAFLQCCGSASFLMPIRIRLSILILIQIRIRILPQVAPKLENQKLFLVLFKAMPVYIILSFSSGQYDFKRFGNSYRYQYLRHQTLLVFLRN